MMKKIVLHPLKKFFQVSKNFPEDKNHNEIIINNNHQRYVIDGNKYAIDFLCLKESLMNQYKQLGFANIIIDNERNWLIKHPEISNAYVQLSQHSNSFAIESVNTQKADIDHLLFYK